MLVQKETRLLSVSSSDPSDVGKLTGERVGEGGVVWHGWENWVGSQRGVVNDVWMTTLFSLRVLLFPGLPQVLPLILFNHHPNRELYNLKFCLFFFKNYIKHDYFIKRAVLSLFQPPQT